MYKTKINEIKCQINLLKQSSSPDLSKITYLENELNDFETKQQEIERTKLDELIQSVQDEYAKLYNQNTFSFSKKEDEIIR